MPAAITNGVLPESTLRKSIVDGLQEQIQDMRKDIMENMNERIDSMVSELLQRLDVGKMPKTESFNNSGEFTDKKKMPEGSLPDKEFVERNSPLTDLFEVKHIRTIYNFFMMIFIVLIMNSAVHDLINSGTINIGTATIIKAFGKLSTTFYIWSLMKCSTFAMYVVFSVWATQRIQFLPKSLTLRCWDMGWLVVFVTYLFAFVILPAKAIVEEDLPIASSVIVLMEQVRLLMKTYAFVRSIAGRFVSYKPHTETQNPQVPEFSKFLYFMFAPTLIYQDSYPRTRKIRWKFVASNYGEVVLITFCVAYIYEQFILPVHRQYGMRDKTTTPVIFNIFSTMIPGFFFFCCGFYCLLHCWMNASAELLRFADRQFYKDWWNSTTYGGYYRTWNIVVHNWLYTYVYKDVYEVVTSRNKVLSTCFVFCLSAIFHEYILALTFRFFYPVMLFMFGVIGLSMVFVTKKVNSNVLVWLSLCTGTGIMISLYSIEYYARINCPLYFNNRWDFYLPRSWFCYEQSS
ncbi:hypothetical protein KM043_008515 [Ampulex compressa]|nr:hypothetical protein KM043_008515 [Ampulex compressa]